MQFKVRESDKESKVKGKPAKPKAQSALEDADRKFTEK